MTNEESQVAEEGITAGQATQNVEGDGINTVAGTAGTQGAATGAADTNQGNGSGNAELQVQIEAARKLLEGHGFVSHNKRDLDKQFADTRRAAEKEIADKARKAAEDASKSETQLAAERAAKAEAERDTYQKELRDLRLKDKVSAAARSADALYPEKVWQDPEFQALLTLDDDGNPTNTDKAVASYKGKYPRMFAGNGRVDGGAGMGTAQTTDMNDILRQGMRR